MGRHRITHDTPSDTPKPTARLIDFTTEDLRAILREEVMAAISEALAETVPQRVRATTDPAQYITERELEKRLGLKPRSLQNRRLLRHDVPPYTKIGSAVRYSLAGVDAWLAAHTTTEDPSTNR
jgi:predicted DNA-binding transcriptional regulator AlpA